MSKRVLTVVHQEQSTTGKVGDFLRARGYSLLRCCPSRGDALPGELSDFALAVVFGGPQSANDDHLPAIRAELDWIERTVLPSDCPLLGICLGAQQIARVLGARVSAHRDGLVEIGYAEVAPTGACQHFLDHPLRFYQWHAEAFDIPEGAEHLATNSAFPGQAFRYDGRVYGIEFHPEMTREMIDRWCTSERGAPKLTWRGAQPHAAQLRDYDRHAHASDRWLDGFLDRLLLPLAVARSQSLRN